MIVGDFARGVTDAEEQRLVYSPYAKVLVKTKTTPKNAIFAIFDLPYLNHHNIPTIENLGANTQLILEQLGISTY